MPRQGEADGLTPKDRVDALADTPRPAPSNSDGEPPGPAAPLAVALQSPKGRAYGTRVLASGRGELAEQILEVARQYGVEIHSDADLAEVLSAIEVDSEIPLAALAAVAEILSYLYQNQDLALAEDPQWEPNP